MQTSWMTEQGGMRQLPRERAFGGCVKKGKGAVYYVVLYEIAPFSFCPQDCQ